MPPKTKPSAAKKAKTGSPPKGDLRTPQKGKGKANAPPKATAAGKKPAYEWSTFTKKSVDFVASAAKLDQYVKSTYGEGVSITQYQKFLVHYAGASDDEKSHLWVDALGIRLARAYETAKVARDDERSSFRGDVQVADVQGTLASLASTFQGPNGPPKRGREDDEEMDGSEEGSNSDE
jgi:hypothetical protein